MTSVTETAALAQLRVLTKGLVNRIMDGENWKQLSSEMIQMNYEAEYKLAIDDGAMSSKVQSLLKWEGMMKADLGDVISKNAFTSVVMNHLFSAPLYIKYAVKDLFKEMFGKTSVLKEESVESALGVMSVTVWNKISSSLISLYGITADKKVLVRDYVQLHDADFKLMCLACVKQISKNLVDGVKELDHSD